MPLKNGCDYETVRENVAKMIREGRDQKQAVAIAIQHAQDQGCNMKALKSAAEAAVKGE